MITTHFFGRPGSIALRLARLVEAIKVRIRILLDLVERRLSRARQTFELTQREKYLYKINCEHRCEFTRGTHTSKKIDKFERTTHVAGLGHLRRLVECDALEQVLRAHFLAPPRRLVAGAAQTSFMRASWRLL